MIQSTKPDPNSRSVSNERSSLLTRDLLKLRKICGRSANCCGHPDYGGYLSSSGFDSVTLGRKNSVPVRRHVDDGPILRSSQIQGLIQTPDLRIPIISPFSLRIGVM